MDFSTYWQHTDLVSQMLFFLLLLLSMMSWIAGLLRLYLSHQMCKNIQDELRDDILSPQKNLLQTPVEQRKTIIEQKLLQQIGRYRFNSEKGLPILGTTAAIAPFIGLFGTVWGIFHALHAIGMSGQAGLGQVAGPVGEALIMTALGLAVAIPAVIFYNISIRINRKALHLANDTAHQLLAESMMETPIKPLQPNKTSLKVTETLTHNTASSLSSS